MVEYEYIDLQSRLLRANPSGLTQLQIKAVERAYKRDPDFRKQYKAKFKNNGIYTATPNAINNFINNIYTAQEILSLIK